MSWVKPTAITLGALGVLLLAWYVYKNKKKNSQKPNSRITLYAGLGLIIVSAILLLLTFLPALQSEMTYLINRPDANTPVSISDNKKDWVAAKVIVAKDKNFSVVIPKIGASAKVIANVDPANSKEYQMALTQGVAHAKGTSLPDQAGNTFLFAHSSDSFFHANTYNAVFYLLNKMEIGDEFYLVYKESLYKYRVIKSAVVDPTETNYYNLVLGNEGRTATLMTCWPPATTLKRLLIVGELEK